MKRKKGYFDQLGAAAANLRKKGVGAPAVAVFSSSAFRPLSACLVEESAIDFSDIACMPISPAGTSPTGTIRFGHLKDSDITLCAVEGRLPLSEGYGAADTAFLVRLAGLLGAETGIFISSGFGLNPDFAMGDLLLVADHINFTGADPLRGLDDERAGPKLLDMTEAYNQDLIGIAEELGIELRIRAHRGTILSCAGPTLPTRAEYRFYRSCGADAVESSSFAVETSAALASEMDVLGVVVLLEIEPPDFLGPVTIEQIMTIENSRQPDVGRLIESVIERFRTT